MERDNARVVCNLSLEDVVLPTQEKGNHVINFRHGRLNPKAHNALFKSVSCGFVWI